MLEFIEPTKETLYKYLGKHNIFGSYIEDEVVLLNIIKGKMNCPYNFITKGIPIVEAIAIDRRNLYYHEADWGWQIVFNHLPDDYVTNHVIPYIPSKILKRNYVGPNTAFILKPLLEHDGNIFVNYVLEVCFLEIENMQEEEERQLYINFLCVFNKRTKLPMKIIYRFPELKLLMLNDI